MKNDTQHLDFLISQYVDGCLEGAGKKSVEQQMLNDPAARQLYTEHREAQDLLDDWGNRIPLIHWDDFDKKLAERLEHETVGSEKAPALRRWLKPLAAAAALFLAASLGYGWHALGTVPQKMVVSNVAKGVAPHTSVEFVDVPTATRASSGFFAVEENGAQGAVVASNQHMDMTISPPNDAAAAESLKQAVGFGLMHVPGGVQPTGISPFTVAAAGVAGQVQKDDKDGAP